MTAPTKVAGFRGQLFYGTAGSTASTLLTKIRDITIARETETGETTTRGDSTKPPTVTKIVTAIVTKIEWQHVYDTSDGNLDALLDAAATGTAVALRGKEYVGGKGPDGDFILTASEPHPLKGETVVTFSAEPTDGYGRDFQHRV